MDGVIVFTVTDLVIIGIAIVVATIVTTATWYEWQLANAEIDRAINDALDPHYETYLQWDQMSADNLYHSQV